MKILAISGGTRNGNNDSICKEVLLAAQEEGAETCFIRLLDLELKHCTGCGFCMRSLNQGHGGACTQKDDFDWLRSQILDADGVLFSIPVFEKGAAGIFHTLLDRFGPRSDIGTNLLGREAAQASGGTPPDPRLFHEKAVAYLGTGGTDYVTRFQCDCRMLSALMLWHTIACEVFDWTTCFEVETHRIVRAHQIGLALTRATRDPAHSPYLGEPGTCSHCGNNNFYLLPNGQAECCICGLKGHLETAEGSLRFCVDSSQLSLAYDTIPGKLHHAADIRRNQAHRAEIKSSALYREQKRLYMQMFPPTLPVPSKTESFGDNVE